MTSRSTFGPPAFRFITDKALREDLEDTLLFAAYLIDIAQKTDEERYREEFHRVIVLYVAAVVEAMCLFLLEKKEIKKEKIEYRHATTVSIEGVVVSNGTGELVVTVKRNKPLSLQEIPFAEAIFLLHKNGVIGGILKKNLDLLRTRRNSQHLYGRDRESITRKYVSDSFDTLNALQKHIMRSFKTKIPQS